MLFQGSSIWFWVLAFNLLFIHISLLSLSNEEVRFCQSNISITVFWLCFYSFTDLCCSSCASSVMPNIVTYVLMEIADEELHVPRSLMNKLRILIRNSMGHHLEVPESAEEIFNIFFLSYNLVFLLCWYSYMLAMWNLKYYLEHLKCEVCNN